MGARFFLLLLITDIAVNLSHDQFGSETITSSVIDLGVLTKVINIEVSRVLHCKMFCVFM